MLIASSKPVVFDADMFVIFAQVRAVCFCHCFFHSPCAAAAAAAKNLLRGHLFCTACYGMKTGFLL
jgi:hypothetical protein